MEYEGTTYRPPPEGDTPLLQVTVGCAHNQCGFCNMYRDVQFRTIPMDRIESDLKEIRYIHPNVKRIFLVNGDAFVLSADKLKAIALKAKKILPECDTISMYASIRNIVTKTDQELQELRSLGIDDLYIGLETGLEDILKNINKGHTIDDADQQLQRLKQAGIDFIVNLMLGIAGQGRGIENAVNSAKLVNRHQPKAIWVGTTVLFEGTELHQQMENGQFHQATEMEKLREEQELIRQLNLKNTRYYANHPSNMVPVSGIIPRDKDRMINQLESGILTYGEEALSKVYQRKTM